MLKITDLVKSYGGGAPVLKNLDLTIEGESVVSIIGSSGAGKSTLLRCINRLVEPTSGSIVLNGTELTSLKGRQLRAARRKIGMVFQGFNLVDRLTVMENVQSGRLGYISTWAAIMRRYPKEDIRRAYELMERVGIAQYANTRADQLSGGERQRVGVVRALMQEPEILLADEPTASLDPKTSEQIMGLLRDLAGELKLPVLINIHNVTEARKYTDRIVGMRFGRIIFDDLPDALDEEAMERIYSGSPHADRGGDLREAS
ncbi:MAG: phosphonate ABC transporter ATP-binding protein [Salipiger thiooxidans]|jgi:phosphonate transport system ATP-binding protein|uniref:Phosphonate transport system ATP-binding protein n=1 Tax=Salipiger thiooxidans TaxID=282683 RepID=A0A1G7FQU7_9RHOB|nr:MULTISPECIES: phosphonate ABC transporter ATP-binding protein [Salipiger]EEX11748.1 phosphonate ABC transporter, ATP-binding protein [Citreicella sp. SE45]NVK59203.1 phosphonate ABC transporter ATP-binding protein [Paracoccaceae bacterium]MCA0848064.1 phosphonate ABC transporter ATP-binding protein [Salipiger thiooxidans]NIY96115.1 phosphonate ABC transporter ATP-binding protein [Salipiger sp. HF18]SDE78277.1 phosphonate transport system ATP-binding protein [Salipiger thiooxidans]